MGALVAVALTARALHIAVVMRAVLRKRYAVVKLWGIMLVFATLILRRCLAAYLATPAVAVEYLDWANIVIWDASI